jgi:flavin reductase (DIM6/NTAB) family NADH-FMN oxidoreductase RutF
MSWPAARNLEVDELRRAFGMFPSGVAAICALVDSAPVGMVASSFTSVSLKPALVSICVAHSSTTWPALRNAPRLGLSVMGADQEGLARQLASKSGDRFAEVGWEAASDQAVFVHGSALWLDCRIDDEVAAGDHNIVVMEVLDAVAYPETSPIVFHGSRFRALAG